jgi:hypothetical protein
VHRTITRETLLSLTVDERGRIGGEAEADYSSAAPGGGCEPGEPDAPLDLEVARERILVLRADGHQRWHDQHDGAPLRLWAECHAAGHQPWTLPCTITPPSPPEATG